MKKIAILILVVFVNLSVKAQTAEALKKEQTPKKKKIKKLTGKIAAIQIKIDEL